jgi:hypothetical protein
MAEYTNIVFDEEYYNEDEKPLELLPPPPKESFCKWILKWIFGGLNCKQ